MWSVLVLAAAAAEPSPALPAVEAAIVPGCPSEHDGTLSACQWRRVLWAHHLWATGRVERLVPSGSAVYNRYVEADAMAAGLVALGVPAARVVPEPRALHSDQNVAFALKLAEAHGWSRMAVASDPFQAPGLCSMIVAWTDRDCTPLSMDVTWTNTRFRAGTPVVRTEPVDAASWLPLHERERRIAVLTGYRRPNSWSVYIGKAILRWFGLSRPPPLPPDLAALQDVR
jgi:hypothetical protein